MYTVRQLKRVPFAKDVLINGEIMVRAIDISEGGLYCHTGRSNIPGRIVEVHIPFRGGYIKVNAKVQHNQEAIGMGLMFVNMKPQQRRTIIELIEGIATEHTDATDAVKNKRGEKRVLLADDNPSTQRIYKSRLVFEGYSVISANDAVEAVKILQEGSGIDAIILDLFTDKQPGFEVLSAAKENPALKDIPIVVLSAVNSEEIMKAVLEKGAVKFLAKINTSPTKLAKTLNRILHIAGRQGKMNCWEFLDCGKGPLGPDAEEREVCPVAVEEKLHGVHDGLNAGRACWARLGTMCGGGSQDSLADKCRSCVKCMFFATVREEEGGHWQDTMQLLHKLDQ